MWKYSDAEKNIVNLMKYSEPLRAKQVAKDLMGVWLP